MPLQPQVFLRQRKLIERPLDFQAKLIHFIGFRKVIERTALHRLNSNSLRAIRSHHNHRGTGWLSLQLAQKIQAILFRHFNIQQEKVGIFLNHNLARG